MDARFSDRCVKTAVGAARVSGPAVLCWSCAPGTHGYNRRRAYCGHPWCCVTPGKAEQMAGSTRQWTSRLHQPPPPSPGLAPSRPSGLLLASGMGPLRGHRDARTATPPPRGPGDPRLGGLLALTPRGCPPSWPRDSPVPPSVAKGDTREARSRRSRLVGPASLSLRAPSVKGGGGRPACSPEQGQRRTRMLRACQGQPCSHHLCDLAPREVSSGDVQEELLLPTPRRGSLGPGTSPFSPGPWSLGQQDTVTGLRHPVPRGRGTPAEGLWPRV